MIASRNVAAAFQRSAPHVERLALNRGPLDAPDAKTIEDVCATLWERRGKRLRPHLVYWFGQMAGVEPERLDLYAWAAEAVHTATLLHDDVIDEADHRRGGRSANKVFDNTLPILSGDYLIADVMHQMTMRGDTALLRTLGRTLKELCSGECIQYELRHAIPPDCNAYDEVTRLKTTSLFAWCASVGPTLSGQVNLSTVEEYIGRFGLLFQLSDDLLDVVGTKTKDRWSDLHDGKLNRVTWKLTNADPSLRREVTRQFQRKTVDTSLSEQFEKSPQYEWVIRTTRKELKDIADEADKILLSLPSSDTRQALRELGQILIDRCV